MDIPKQRIRKPVQIKRINGDADPANYRNLDCLDYADCVDVAVKNGWHSFACFGCPQAPGLKEPEAPQMKPKNRKPKTAGRKTQVAEIEKPTIEKPVEAAAPEEPVKAAEPEKPKKICVCCNREVQRFIARRLCSACYWKAKRDGKLDDFPPIDQKKIQAAKKATAQAVSVKSMKNYPAAEPEGVSAGAEIEVEVGIEENGVMLKIQQSSGFSIRLRISQIAGAQ